MKLLIVGSRSIKEFDLSDHTEYLKFINFSNCTSLEKLNLYVFGLSDLNVTDCISLKDFFKGTFNS